jgi:hypothetical protein
MLRISRSATSVRPACSTRRFSSGIRQALLRPSTGLHKNRRAASSGPVITSSARRSASPTRKETGSSCTPAGPMKNGCTMAGRSVGRVVASTPTSTFTRLWIKPPPPHSRSTWMRWIRDHSVRVPRGVVCVRRRIPAPHRHGHLAQPGAGPRAARLGFGDVAVTVPGAEDIGALCARLTARSIPFTGDSRTILGPRPLGDARYRQRARPDPGRAARPVNGGTGKPSIPHRCP